ncbi:hypothetical protein ABG067_006005 [Albugo candida]
MVANNNEAGITQLLSANYHDFQNTYFKNAPAESIEDVQKFIVLYFPTSFRNKMLNIQANGVPDYSRKVLELTLVMVGKLYTQLVQPCTEPEASFLDWVKYISDKIQPEIVDQSVIDIYSCMIVFNALSYIVFQVMKQDIDGADTAKAMSLGN